ncbi:hypothetical protein C943_04418 [Mariniradius saccharolyticus AK6]|uniref:Uncharacterized protein n=1 Tax=Mariniradius saccharolyticus AK6 TaxID=1239962 RepID=M7X813_9BACT|nr:hypothetical protein C943_04418 [Mariniradius saccharolyticus AK6]
MLGSIFIEWVESGQGMLENWEGLLFLEEPNLILYEHNRTKAPYLFG